MKTSLFSNITGALFTGFCAMKYNSVARHHSKPWVLNVARHRLLSVPVWQLKIEYVLGDLSLDQVCGKLQTTTSNKYSAISI